MGRLRLAILAHKNRGLLVCSALIVLAFALSVVILWDVQSKQRGARLYAQIAAHEGLVTALSVSADGRMLLSGGTDGVLRVWQLPAGTPIASFRAQPVGIRSVSFAPSGTTVASGGQDGTVKLWNLSDRTVLTSLDAHDDAIITLQFTIDGKILVTEGVLEGIRMWDTGEWQSRPAIPDYLGSQTPGIAVSPDGRALAVAGYSVDFPKLYDIETGAEVCRFSGEYVGGAYCGVRFSPDGKLLATGTWRNSIILWNTASGAQVGALKVNSWRLCDSLCFSSDGARLAAATRSGGLLATSELSVWDVASRRKVVRLKAPFVAEGREVGEFSSLLFGDSGSLLVSGHVDGTICVWFVKRKKR